MDWHHLEGNWEKFKGKIKDKWGKFTDDDLKQIAGKKDELIGRIKHVYGSAHEDAVKQSQEFLESLRGTDDEKKEETQH